MAWTDNAGGIFMLQASRPIRRQPGRVDVRPPRHVPSDRAKELEAKVVPGSGLPYVLDDPGMELLAQGFDGIGTSVSQRYIPTTGDGDVVLTVGDYTGQLAALGGPFPVEETTIAGQPGVRYTTNSSTVFVWRTPDKSWAQLSIAAPAGEPSRRDRQPRWSPHPLPTDPGTTSTTIDRPSTRQTDTITSPEAPRRRQTPRGRTLMSRT